MPLFGGRKQQDVKPIGGLLAYYGLVDWWLATFSPAERTEIEFMWAPLGGGPCPLTWGHFSRVNKSAAEFLVALAHRFPQSTIASRINAKVAQLTNNNPPGCINGQNCSAYVPQAHQLIGEGRLDEVAPLVSAICDALESEWRAGVDLVSASEPPPAPYWAFAVAYRKQKAYEQEVAVLERYLGQLRRYSRMDNKRAAEFAERLEKANLLLAKSLS